jgi:serine/threonine protein kinase
MRERFGRYEIVCALAEGGLGQIHLAQRDGSPDLCALKVLRGGLRGDDVAAKRLRREAHVGSYLQHPNIARVIDAGIEGETFYLAVEIVPGESLGSLLDYLDHEQSRLPAPLAARICVDVLRGLSYAHQALDAEGRPLAVVHRDLSPGNVLLGFDGGVKIIDFSAAFGNVHDFSTMPGTVIGTPRYLAPERVLGQRLDQRSDLYSVAVLLFEMLSGRPFAPDVSMREVLRWLVTGPVPRLIEVEPTISPELDRVVAKGLARNPNERWQSAAAFAAALEQAAGPASTSEELAALVRSLYPDRHSWYASMIALAKKRFSSERQLASTKDDIPRSTLALLAEPSPEDEEITNVDLMLSSVPPLERQSIPPPRMIVPPPAPQSVRASVEIIPEALVGPGGWIAIALLVVGGVLIAALIAAMAMQ